MTQASMDYYSSCMQIPLAKSLTGLGHRVVYEYYYEPGLPPLTWAKDFHNQGSCTRA